MGKKTQQTMWHDASGVWWGFSIVEQDNIHCSCFGDESYYGFVVLWFFIPLVLSLSSLESTNHSLSLPPSNFTFFIRFSYSRYYIFVLLFMLEIRSCSGWVICGEKKKVSSTHFSQY